MIQAIGLDAVEIERFAHWHTFSCSQLERIFSSEEIAYCLSIPALSAQRFAARFAAREAFFKALCQAYPNTHFSLLTVCRAIQVITTSTAPYLQINWHKLMPELSHQPTCLISLTHTASTAIAQVVLYTL